MAFRDDQEMARIDRVLIEDGLGQIVFEDRVLNGAQKRQLFIFTSFGKIRPKNTPDFYNFESCLLKSIGTFLAGKKVPKNPQRDQGPLTPLLFIRGF
jgi:hypothetical protein